MLARSTRSAPVRRSRPTTTSVGRSSSEAPLARTVHLIEKDVDGTPLLRPVTIKVGIADNTNSEVVSGLKEGDVVVVGSTAPAAAAGAAPAVQNPFGPPSFGGPPRR